MKVGRESIDFLGKIKIHAQSTEESVFNQAIQKATFHATKPTKELKMRSLVCALGSLCYSVVISFISSGYSFAETSTYIGKDYLFQQQLVIGTDDINQPNYNFGKITGIATDTRGNIYVGDNGLYRILKFSSKGQFLHSFGVGNGMEPGEFMDPRGIAVDKDNNLFVADLRMKRITVFQEEGTLLRTIETSMMPGELVIDKEGAFYVIGLPESFEGPLVHKYDASGQFVTAFCDREGIHDLAFRSGNIGCIAIDSDQHIYYALPYPYEIRKFSSDGKLLATIKRPDAGIGAPLIDKEVPVIRMADASRGLVVLPDGKIANVFSRYIDRQESNEKEYYFDLFSPEGKLLATVPLSDCIEHYIRSAYFHADKDGYMYMVQFGPYLSVVKYALNYYQN